MILVVSLLVVLQSLFEFLFCNVEILGSYANYPHVVVDVPHHDNVVVRLWRKQDFLQNDLKALVVGLKSQSEQAFLAHQNGNIVDNTAENWVNFWRGKL